MRDISLKKCQPYSGSNFKIQAASGLFSKKPYFSGDVKAERQSKIQDEFKRLQKNEPLFRYISLLPGGTLPLLGFLFPTPLMPSLQTLVNLPLAPIILSQRGKEINLQRARFNITGNKNNLNPFLPYRRLLTQLKDKESGAATSLRQYDQLVAEVLEKAEFYEVDKSFNLEKLVKKITEPDSLESWTNLSLDGKKNSNPEKPQQKSLFQTLYSLYSFDKRKALYSKSQKEDVEKLKKIKDESLVTQLKNNSQSVCKLSRDSQDPSTRYLAAAQMVDLYHKNPVLLKQLLNDPKGHPLRFMLKKNQAVLMGGWYKPGLNLIALNKAAFWYTTGNHTIAQHESIHAASDINFKAKSVLPVMSAEQKKQFKQARADLITQYKQKDETLFGKARYWLTGKTSSGIRNYAFLNNYEFLTVTLDTFKIKPKQLVKTKAGQRIYDIYKDIFKIDPLNDFSPPKAGFKVAFQRLIGKEPYLDLRYAE